MDGCPPLRGPADDQLPTFTPRKMIRPALVIGVEQGDSLACVRIDAGDMGMLEPIAVPTGETKIVKVISAAESLGDDMVNGERRASDLFAGAAITARIPGAPGHFAAYCGAERRGHSLVGTINSEIS